MKFTSVKQTLSNKIGGFNQITTSTSIFDIFDDVSSYPPNTFYWTSPDNLTNGETDLKTLLNIGNYATVEIHKYSEHSTSITIFGHSTYEMYFGKSGKNAPNILFTCIKAGTTDKVTGVTVNRVTL